MSSIVRQLVALVLAHAAPDIYYILTMARIPSRTWNSAQRFSLWCHL